MNLRKDHYRFSKLVFAKTKTHSVLLEALLSGGFPRLSFLGAARLPCPVLAGAGLRGC